MLVERTDKSPEKAAPERTEKATSAALERTATLDKGEPAATEQQLNGELERTTASATSTAALQRRLSASAGRSFEPERPPVGRYPAAIDQPLGNRGANKATTRRDSLTFNSDRRY